MNTIKLRLNFLIASVFFSIGYFTTIVASYALGFTPATKLDGEVRIFIGIVMMAIFLNIWLRHEIKELESEDEDIYEYE